MTSVISSVVPFKIVLQKGGLLILKKSPSLACLVSQIGKTTTPLAFLAQFLAVVAQVYLVDGKNASGSSVPHLWSF